MDADTPTAETAYIIILQVYPVKKQKIIEKDVKEQKLAVVKKCLENGQENTQESAHDVKFSSKEMADAIIFIAETADMNFASNAVPQLLIT